MSRVLLIDPCETAGAKRVVEVYDLLMDTGDDGEIAFTLLQCEVAPVQDETEAVAVYTRIAASDERPVLGYVVTTSAKLPQDYGKTLSGRIGKPVATETWKRMERVDDIAARGCRKLLAMQQVDREEIKRDGE